MMILRLFMTAFLAVALASAPAFACKGPKVLFEDDFKEADPGWPIDDSIAIASGHLQVRSPAGEVRGVMYSGATFEDADMCVDVAVTAARDPTAVVGGLVFWYDDWDNFWALLFSPEGSATVYRVQKKKALNPVTWRKAAAIKTEPNAVTSLRIAIKGTALSTFINDRPFAAFKGQPPEGGGLVGFWASSEPGAPNTFTSSNFKLTTPR
jgi:hypothetical protein